MSIKELSKQVTELEGGNKQVNIAQVKEILKVINDITEGEFYKFIRKIK